MPVGEVCMCWKASQGLNEVDIGGKQGQEKTSCQSGHNNAGGRKDDGDDGKPLSACPSSIE